MYANILTLSLASVAAAAPFSFPLSNGFPTVANPSNTLTQIELAAHGSLPNAAPPASISVDTLNSLRLIAFNELFEVAFFTELIANITTNKPGYQLGSDRSYVLAALKAVQAQEELHTLNANGAIAHFKGNPIQPCKYNFPVNSFEEAIGLASTFTDVVLGTLQDVTTKFGLDGDAPLIRGVASVIGQEGEQNGFYRNILGKTPSALPFLTTSTREFAFSALNQNFVVPNSCPNIGDIQLPIFAPLTLETQTVKAKAQTLTFSIAVPENKAQSYTTTYGSNYEKLSLVYINQQNVPVIETPKHVTISKGKVEFEVYFPFTGTTFGNGLTIAVLATGDAAALDNADDVAKLTQFGPALIEVN